MTHHPPARPARVTGPRTYTDTRPHPQRAGLPDIRALPREPVPAGPRHLAASAVGARLATGFDGIEITDPTNALPGAVLITYAPAYPPGEHPGQVAAAVEIALAGRFKPDVVALWPGPDSAGPEITRPPAIFAARRHGRSTR